MAFQTVRTLRATICPISHAEPPALSSHVAAAAAAPALKMARSAGVRDVLQEEYAQWVQKQEEIIMELGQALQAECDETLVSAVDRAVQHYHDYYQLGTGIATSQRNYSLAAGPGASAVEKALMWMGSWPRPSMAFQVLYALMGHQIQAELEELLELGNAVDGGSGSLASLSAWQLSQLNDLQTDTVKEEDRIERETAKLQQSIASQPLTLSGSSSLTADSSVLGQKLAVLQDLSVQADALRLSTIERLLEVLRTPSQKAQFLLASAKLQVALRKLGHTEDLPPLARGP